MEMFRQKSGFTFVEIIVVLAILLLLATISTVTFQNMRNAAALKVGGEEVRNAFSHARTSALASENDTVHGVHISSTTVTRFVGTTYNSGASTNRPYTFEGGVFASSTLIQSGTDVIFAKLTGKPSASGVVELWSADRMASTSIQIHPSGLIE